MSKYIFCATTGFNNHNSLYWIFSFAEDVCSSRNSGYTMEGFVGDYNRYKTEEVTKSFVKSKIPSIDLLIKTENKSRYFESNKYFIKSFAKIACNILKNEIAILHLIGNPIDTSIKMCEEKQIPNFSDQSILNLRFPANRIKPDFVKYREYRHPFFRTLWYCFEIYSRSKELVSNYRNIRHYIFFEKWLNNEIEIKAMLGSFGIKITKRKLFSASRINSKLGQLTNLTRKTIQRDKAERAALRFIDRFGDQINLREEECLELISL